ncbi:MAG: hypothetical protein ACTSR2_00225 [Candidatus Hodarchaeales archaeon]
MMTFEEDVVDFSEEEESYTGGAPEGYHVGTIRIAEVRRAKSGNRYIKLMITVGSYSPINALMFLNYSQSRRGFMEMMEAFNVKLERRPYTFSELNNILSVVIGERIRFKLTYDKKGFAQISDIKRYSGEGVEQPKIPNDDDTPPF